MPQPVAVQKICTVCKKDVSQRKRTKDSKGRYYCDPCWTATVEAQRRRAAKSQQQQQQQEPQEIPEELPQEVPQELPSLDDLSALPSLPSLPVSAPALPSWPAAAAPPRENLRPVRMIPHYQRRPATDYGGAAAVVMGSIYAVIGVIGALGVIISLVEALKSEDANYGGLVGGAAWALTVIASGLVLIGRRQFFGGVINGIATIMGGILAAILLMVLIVSFLIGFFGGAAALNARPTTVTPYQMPAMPSPPPIPQPPPFRRIPGR